MHFSKIYPQLLSDLPPELTENAIQYRQLKKLIKQVVAELSLVGLSPTILQDLLEETVQKVDRDIKGRREDENGSSAVSDDAEAHNSHPRVVYEVNNASGRIEPRLRIWITPPSSPRLEDVESVSVGSSSSHLTHGSGTVESEDVDTNELREDTTLGEDKQSLIWALQRRMSSSRTRPSLDTIATHPELEEIVIPLASDTAFFQLLSKTLISLSNRLLSLHTNFVDSLKTLGKDIGSVARPVSSGHSYHPHSMLSNPGTIKSPSSSVKSDLYSWREIFQIYVETEVFETVSEVRRGENSVEESERRLKLFAGRVAQRGLVDERALKLKQSRDALQTFLELNMFILNIKKFQIANAEATRKILKKHAKRTALKLPSGESGSEPSSTGLASFGLQESLARVLMPKVYLRDPQGLDSHHMNTNPLDMNTPVVTYTFASLPRVLVQAVGETLLPIIPHIDDYSCAICTNIAFKPIRLNCGHLFCVRCLVKMQKRGQGDCPMCRAPTVLVADRCLPFHSQNLHFAD
ncbi:hypothetical protein E1B28_005899 [Marasmius oreades]|uniref:RING-type domain-containing protein n=1 Tax=Marasmius oreades TaxID=181124 RepID=A0A9P7S4G9_9AGAR|nr:uncharacterized protein E1B28_005899 [Marasmius oreades]KAG7095115.1 hypothetical protein E1B28_005899 [Marasmius oreades]